MCGHFLFGVTKLVFWQETAAIPFMVLDLLVIVLLTRRGASPGPPQRQGDEASRESRRGAPVYFIAGTGFEPGSSTFCAPVAVN
jgi:hypothetical protein